MDPESQLFDAACEVLDYARSLAAAARVEPYRGAVPATLGCLAAAFESLADTSASLRAQADPGVHVQLAELAWTLKRASLLADDARASAARLRAISPS